MNPEDRIQPYHTNPHDWQYKGQPALLIGGSIEDNLYQIANLAAHRDQSTIRWWQYRITRVGSL